MTKTFKEFLNESVSIKDIESALKRKPKLDLFLDTITGKTMVTNVSVKGDVISGTDSKTNKTISFSANAVTRMVESLDESKSPKTTYNEKRLELLLAYKSVYKYIDSDIASIGLSINELKELKKIDKEMTKVLSGLDKLVNAALSYKSLDESKSKEAQFVLQTVDNDEDADYSAALKIALEKFPNVNKSKLEKELEKYI